MMLDDKGGGVAASETWKAVPGYEGYYEASTMGRVRSVDRVVVLTNRLGADRPCVYKSRVLKPRVGGTEDRHILPRCQVVLSKDGDTKSIQVQRIIAETFIPNPDRLETVNHKDGNPQNNAVENLEWASRAENNRHAFKNNLIHTMKPVTMYDAGMRPIATFPGEAEACRRIGISQGKVGFAARTGRMCRGYYWKYRTEPNLTVEEWHGE